MTPSDSPRLTRWMWLLAALLMLAEFLLFDRMTSRHYASVYPRWNDQIQYLTESYTAFAQTQTHGLLAGLQFALSKTALQGTLHDFFAVIVFWLTGSASRSAALSLNMMIFLAWQVGMLVVIPRVSGLKSLGWLGFGLLLCLAAPWSGEPGSAVDFRLDHAAMCLMGLAALVALRTDGFRSTRWAAVLGFIVGIAMLERFLTSVYFAVILFASLVWILCGDSRGLRLRNLGIAGLVAAALALPVFWASRAAIYTYYWVGHVTGAESAARFHPLTFWHSLQFIFGNLAVMHLGRSFGVTVACVTVALLALFAFGPRKRALGPESSWLFVALTFLFAPAVVLCLHRQKSEYVLGVLVPGLVLLVLWVWTWFWRRIDFDAFARGRRAVPILFVLGVVASGAGYFASRPTLPSSSPTPAP